MRIGILTTILLIACGRDRLEPERPTIMEINRSDCLEEAPPQPRGIKTAGPADGCPEEWGACLDKASLAELVRYIGRIQVWSEEAWNLCGPLEEEQ